MNCPVCGQENPAGFKFCGACGAELDAAPATAREERKVITVLFADLVGFTSRAEKLDPEDVRAMLSPYYARLRHELERHGGTVEKFIGDAVVALFGAPIAHEDDPERAVRAAIAIREAIVELNEADPTLELEVRIAVNTGEALVALGARPDLGEGMASGDVVNTAARLQTAAPVDGILVGEATYRATSHVIEYRDALPVEAKGKANPVPAWEAVAARARFGFDVEQRPRTQLVGRARELDVLTGALDRVRQDLSPQLVTLVGVPGIGKSRLIAELFQIVDRDLELILWRQGRSLPYGEGLSYWAVAEIVKSQVGILETDSTEAAEAKLRASVTEAIDDQQEAGWIERHLRPLVLLDVVDYLADWASGVALLIVGTARPELLSRRPGWGGGKRNASTVTVSALAPDETAALLAALLDQVLLPAEVQAAVLKRTEGNPLFAEEYVRMLQDRGFLVQTGGGWQLEEREQLPLPETVQGMIAARLDSLEAVDKELVQNAAVLGKVFWTGALAALTGRERFLVEEQLHGLERKEFVRRERRSGVAGETQYAFLHLLLRDVAYSQIPRSERADKHSGAAAWIESLSADRSEDRAEMLAHHYLEALKLLRITGGDESTLREPARKALTEAGERSRALHAPTAAADFFEQALELTAEDDPGRASLLLTYAHTKSVLGDAPVELAQLAHDVGLASGQLEVAAEALTIVAQERWVLGEIDSAIQLARDAFALVADLPPSRTKAFVRVALANRLWISGLEDEGLALACEGLAEAEALGAEDVAANALRGIGTVRAIRGDEGGLADLERSVELGEKLSDPLMVHLGLNNLANMLWHFGRIAEGAGKLQLDRESQNRFGLTPESGTMRWLQGEEVMLLEMSGAWKECLRAAREFLTEMGDVNHYLVGPILMMSSSALMAQGDVRAALADSQRGFELARAIRDPQLLHSGLEIHARALLLDGQRREAEELVDELLALTPQLNEWFVKDLPWLVLDIGREQEYLEQAKSMPADRK